MDELVRLVTYLAVVSVAAERAVDIVKRALVQRLSLQTFNGALYQALAGVFGAAIAYWDKPRFDFITTDTALLTVLIALGVSGGSGAWNTLLQILKQLTLPKAGEVDHTEQNKS